MFLKTLLFVLLSSFSFSFLQHNESLLSLTAINVFAINEWQLTIIRIITIIKIRPQWTIWRSHRPPVAFRDAPSSADGNPATAHLWSWAPRANTIPPCTFSSSYRCLRFWCQFTPAWHKEITTQHGVWFGPWRLLVLATWWCCLWLSTLDPMERLAWKQAWWLTNSQTL